VSPQGTHRYEGLTDLPPLVERAVDLARREGFAHSCRPEHGRLLYALAAGAARIGETGTGCGVGLAWLASGARPGTRLFTVERDAGRAALAAGLFAGQPQVTVIQGDWTKIAEEAPFDLLALDGGGQGKADGNPQASQAPETPADPEALLRPGGTFVIDDLTPASTWPPLFAGQPDPGRMHWHNHPAVDATELRLAPDLAALVVTRRFPG
jgi:predicted O-methyltransferase YrrM